MSGPLSFAQETNVLAGNLVGKFDFTLVKCEAPLEYRAIGNCLSPKRKENAEDGTLHQTARQLGALFQSELPDVPSLIKAYGERATEILRRPDVNPRGSSRYGPFADHVGADGSTIWAAATSGESTILMHLLACMLARIWKQAEATSIWVELVEQRQALLKDKTQKQTIFGVGDLWATRISISRKQLADWDASARAWLSTADEARRLQATQLRLIVENLSLAVSQETVVYSAVVSVISSALKALDELIQGRPLRIQNGAVLLGISSWHLYPNLLILGETARPVEMNDSLMPDSAVVTIGMEDRSLGTDDGIYWSLPLAHMRFYGDPIRAIGKISIQESQVTFEQFLYVFLGYLLGCWLWRDANFEVAFAIIREISKNYSGEDRSPREDTMPDCVEVILSVVQKYDNSPQTERQQMIRLISFGREEGLKFRAKVSQKMRKSRLGGTLPRALLIPFFGLVENSNYFPNWTSPDGTNDHMTRLRQWALVNRLNQYAMDRSDVIIRTFQPPDTYVFSDCFTSVSSVNREQSDEIDVDSTGSYRTWLQSDSRPTCVSSKLTEVQTKHDRHRQQRFPSAPDGPLEDYSFLFGDSTRVAIFCRSSIVNLLLLQMNPISTFGQMSANELLSLLRDKSISSSQLDYTLYNFTSRHFDARPDFMDAVLSARKVYYDLPGALVNLNVLRHMNNAEWARQESTLSYRDPLSTESKFACIILFESGSVELDPVSLRNAIAVSMQNSLYVHEYLIRDVYGIVDGKKHGVRRIAGNIGEPGISVLFPPHTPRVSTPEYGIWQMEQEYFDGRRENNFTSTSCHLSLTGNQSRIDGASVSLRDSRCTYMEAVISVFDRGRWIADLDVKKVFDNLQPYLLKSCPDKHGNQEAGDSSIFKHVMSVASWDRLLDSAPREQIVLADKNPGARLAAACIALQKKHSLTILPTNPCWKCVKNSLDDLARSESIDWSCEISNSSDSGINTDADTDHEDYLTDDSGSDSCSSRRNSFQANEEQRTITLVW